MDNEKFKEALKSTYCNDPNISLPLLLRTVNFYFCKYAPLTRITKKIKTHNKSWLKKDILTSVSNKNRIYKKFFKAKYPNKRDSLHHQLKINRNLNANLTKISKEKYYKTYFPKTKITYAKRRAIKNNTCQIDQQCATTRSQDK